MLLARQIVAPDQLQPQLRFLEGFVATGSVILLVAKIAQIARLQIVELAQGLTVATRIATLVKT